MIILTSADISWVSRKSALCNHFIGYVSHLILITTCEIALLVRTYSRWGLESFNNLPESRASTWWGWCQICQRGLQILGLFHFFMTLYHGAESLAASLSPSCLWNCRKLSAPRLSGEASRVQCWARCHLTGIEKMEERCSWLNANTHRPGPQPSTDRGPRNKGWGPSHFISSVFNYREACESVASSPYFIPASVWSAGMKTTGSPSSSK